MQANPQLPSVYPALLHSIILVSLGMVAIVLSAQSTGVTSSRGAQQIICGFFGIHRVGELDTVAVAPAMQGHRHPPSVPAPAQPVIPVKRHGA
eukprot:364623-Chlamydomonas_euryale.AAC.7